MIPIFSYSSSAAPSQRAEFGSGALLPTGEIAFQLMVRSHEPSPGAKGQPVLGNCNGLCGAGITTVTGSRLSERFMAPKGMSKVNIEFPPKLVVIVLVHSVLPPLASKVRFSGREDAVPIRIPPELNDCVGGKFPDEADERSKGCRFPDPVHV